MTKPSGDNSTSSRQVRRRPWYTMGLMAAFAITFTYATQQWLKADCSGILTNSCPMIGSNPCMGDGCFEVEDECSGQTGPTHWTEILAYPSWPSCQDVLPSLLNRTCEQSMVQCGVTIHYIYDTCAGTCESTGFWRGCQGTKPAGSGCP
jgi:hypothetical protein